MIKRYALFAYETYYPSGGWSDFIKDSDSIEWLKKEFGKITRSQECYPTYERMHIVDLETKEKIWAMRHIRDDMWEPDDLD